MSSRSRQHAELAAADPRRWHQSGVAVLQLQHCPAQRAGAGRFGTFVEQVLGIDLAQPVQGERWPDAETQQTLASGRVNSLDAHRAIDGEAAAVFRSWEHRRGLAVQQVAYVGSRERPALRNAWAIRRLVSLSAFDMRNDDKARNMAKKRNEESGTAAGKGGAKHYEKELARLQVELAHLQSWVVKTGARIVVVFEGRDAAGKGGMIKRITERVSPRVFRVVALPAPTDRQKTQIYMQRYVEQLPAAGEVVVFDRSWYNRPGVERVMGFCGEQEAKRYLALTPHFETYLIESGITLVKYFLTVSEAEQEKRFHQRILDPLRQWKLSPMDIESYRRWWDYSVAYDEMIHMTDTPQSPWWIVPSDDKKRARINCISHLLSVIPYKKVPFKKPVLGKRNKRPKDYVPDQVIRNVVPDVL